MNENEKSSVLIVDDDTVSIMKLSHILETEYTVYTAKNGPSALRTAQKYHPDVILLDIIMPGMDGYEVLTKLKSSEKTKDIPVIFITGLSKSENEEKGLALGAADYISKTLSDTIIKLRVRHHIQLVRQLRNNENLNKSLEAALKEAEIANQAKSSFLASMNHEIRTPMNAILGVTEMLMHDEDLSPQAQEMVSRIYGSGELLLGIINEILDLSKIEAGKPEPNVIGGEEVDILKHLRTNPSGRIKSKTAAREPMPYGSVLIVDDNESNLYVATGLLRPYRLKVDTAMSGEEAIGKINSGKTYDVVFMDHMMPGMDGVETTGLLRAGGYKDPIVALTANAVSGQEEIFLQSGFDDYISKPIDTRKLDAVLVKLIRDKQPPEVLEAARTQMKEKQDAADENPGNGAAGQRSMRLLESFSRDAQKSISLVEELLQSGRIGTGDGLRQFTISVHGIKSSLANVGEIALSEAAFSLEQAGRDKDINKIRAQTPPFLAGLKQLLERITQEIKLRDDDTSGNAPEQLHDKLLALQKMCADYNRKGALDIIAAIKSCPPEAKQVLEEIAALIGNSDFEDAEEAAAQYAAAISPAPKCSLAGYSIEGLDIIAGLDKFDGDEKTYIKILRSYTNGVRDKLSAIELFDKENLYGYRIVVHSIKGMSLDIFATETGKCAAGLEEAAKSGDTRYIEENNAEFIETAKCLADRIDAMLSDIDTQCSCEVKDKPDAQALSKLLEACESYDMAAADAAMEEIGRFKYQSDDGLADWLQKNIDLANYAGIAGRLTAVLSKSPSPPEPKT